MTERSGPAGQTREPVVLGRRVEISGDPQDTYFTSLGGEVDDDVLYLLAKIVPDDAVVFDVGANIGLHSIALAQLAPKGFVHAVEPIPRTAGHLEANLRRNGVTNAEVHRVALGSAPGELTIYENREFAAGSTVIDDSSFVARTYADRTMTESEESQGSFVKVPTTTLDLLGVQRGFDKLDLVKIDAEGHDIEVLRGGIETIRSMNATALVEFASFALTTQKRMLPQDALDEIRSMFQRVFVVQRWGSLREITNDTQAWDFLYENATTRAVADLLCGFADSRLLAGVDALIGPQPAPHIEELRARIAELEGELNREQERTRHLDQEIEALKQTLSWRVTKPLRAVRRRL
ncbi:MAG: FkbM family methyltransferase [Actinomycetota bacterium]